jgi:hypothetical protein
MIRHQPANSSIGDIGTAEAFAVYQAGISAPTTSCTFPVADLIGRLRKMRMRDERILIFEGWFVAVIAPDRSFEVARMDGGETT